MVEVTQLEGTISRLNHLEGQLTVPKESGSKTPALTIQGTFTTPATPGKYEVRLPYNAADDSDFQTAALIMADAQEPSPSEDFYHSEVLENSIVSWSMNKLRDRSDPTHAGRGTENLGICSVVYRTNGEYACVLETNACPFNGGGAYGLNPENCVAFGGPDVLTYYVHSGHGEPDEYGLNYDEYGLAANTTYKYIISYYSFFVTEEG